MLTVLRGGTHQTIVRVRASVGRLTVLPSRVWLAVAVILFALLPTLAEAQAAGTCPQPETSRFRGNFVEINLRKVGLNYDHDQGSALVSSGGLYPALH
jgi:hypothetical protein